MNNRIVLGSIALDLQRVALGYHRGSLTMANRFHKEALKRKEEIDENSVKPYIKKLLGNIEHITLEKDKEKVAENALLYSILLQNAAVVA